MRFVLFYHSLISDWNHGNAHFLRGVVTELIARGHEVVVYEPQDAWSVTNLLAEQGAASLKDFQQAYPLLSSRRYSEDTLNLDIALRDADVVIVHEWNTHSLVRMIGEHRSRHDYRLLFHDTHHRAVTDAESMASYSLAHYDGVLAFGEVIRAIYVERGWAARAWTWHEAADTRVFRPMPQVEPVGELVWIGNWGDDERTAELHEFLLEPVKALGLKARAHGVRYPAAALHALADAGITYGGWLPNYQVPQVFAQHKVTVHVPRRPYAQKLTGIPTIRPFEALACGIPLVSAPWDDCENLFTPGQDYLVARNGREMQKYLRDVLHDEALARSLAEHGLASIRARHTCSHRVDELMAILATLGLRNAQAAMPLKEHTPL